MNKLILLFLYLIWNISFIYATQLELLQTELKSLELRQCEINMPKNIQYVFGRTKKPSFEGTRANLKDKIIKLYHPDEIKLQTNDGKELSAFLFKRENAKYILLICHGYWMSKEYLESIIKLFDQPTLFVPDLRTHGDSEGSMISFGYYESEDIRASVNYIKSQESLKNLPIFGLGVSMGALVILKAAAENAPFNGLILDSFFLDADHVICYIFKRWSELPFCNCDLVKAEFENFIRASTKGIDPLTLIKLIKNIPVMFIHSIGDRMVPMVEVEKLVKEKKGKKSFWEVKDTKIPHAGIASKVPSEYKKRITGFIDSILYKK